MILAFDAIEPDAARAASFSRRFFSTAVENELLLRPIGRTVYLMPPYVLDDEEIALLGSARAVGLRIRDRGLTMDLIDNVNHKLAALDAQSLLRRRRIADTRCTPLQVVDGRAMLAFCSNDYLGLAAHPRVVDALRAGAQLYGAGSGASHLISGHSRAHALLEERLAELAAPHIEDARALYLSTGYMANLAVLTALGLDADAMIFSEALNHASLIDGARLAKAGVTVYPHGDVAALEALLAASSATTKIVATDAVFSMDGDLAPLPQLLAAVRTLRRLAVGRRRPRLRRARRRRAAAPSNISACARRTSCMSAPSARRPASAAPSSPPTPA